MFQKPKQDQIIPRNAIEAQFLETTPLYYGDNSNVVLTELKMESADRDLKALEMMNLTNPMKQVKVKRRVEHSLPGSGEILVDYVERIESVPMTNEELMQEYQLRIDELKGINMADQLGDGGLVLDPSRKPAEEKKDKKPAKKAAKASKQTAKSARKGGK